MFTMLNFFCRRTIDPTEPRAHHVKMCSSEISHTCDGPAFLPNSIVELISWLSHDLRISGSWIYLMEMHDSSTIVGASC